MRAVKATPFTPKHLVAQVVAAGARHGFHIHSLSEIASCPIVALTRRSPGLKPRIYLSSGVHGDEPAAPLALLHLLERGVFDDRAVWFLLPLLNPTGFELATRENRLGVDLNRDYREPQTLEVSAHVQWLKSQPRFDISFCFHEDWESEGFYLYELNPLSRPSLAEPMIQAVGSRFPIDRSPIIDGRAADGGIIRPVNDPALRDLWPEAIYLRAHHTHLSYTLETPSSAALVDRVEMFSLALTSALEAVLTSQKRAFARERGRSASTPAHP